MSRQVKPYPSTNNNFFYSPKFLSIKNMKRSCQYRRRIRKKTRSSNIIHITIRPSSEARSFTTSTKTKISAPDISTASKLPILKDDKNLVYDHHRKIHLTKKYIFHILVHFCLLFPSDIVIDIYFLLHFLLVS